MSESRKKEVATDERPEFAEKYYTPNGGVYVKAEEMMKTRKMDENRRKLRVLRERYGERPESEGDQAQGE